MSNQITVISTGEQLGYEQGEIMCQYPNTPYGLMQAVQYANGSWYNKPAVQQDGRQVDALDYLQDIENQIKQAYQEA